MTRFSTIMIAAVAGLATPAIASAAPKPVAPAQADTAQAPAARTQRYCIVSQVTGSRVDHRECRTLDAWLARGVDPRETK